MSKDEKTNDRFALGLHIPKFYSKIIDVEDCKLQSEISNGILNFTREFFKSRNACIYNTHTHTGYLRFLVIRQSRNTDDLMVNLITSSYEKEIAGEYSKELLNNFPSITTIVNSTTERKAQVAFSEKEYVLHGEGFIYEILSNNGRQYKFKISPNSFFQTNTSQTEILYKTGLDFLMPCKNDSILDLYCGAGSISIFTSNLVKNVTGVEIVKDAVDNANENALINYVTNVNFIESDIKDFMKQLELANCGYNKVILDPPRAGLHPDICRILSETNFEKILYISCNPGTQARDLQIICSNNRYRIEKIQPVDMFPQTYHVENVCLLSG
jgi:23S rRNA (uracil1939-C5)-methyltransferase